MSLGSVLEATNLLGFDVLQEARFAGTARAIPDGSASQESPRGGHE